jgi:RHS repeat-associated protein
VLATLTYDPNGRLWQVTGPNGTTRLEYDGDKLVEEFSGAGTQLRVYAHGPGVDEPLVWWEVSPSWLRHFLHADHQGSITAIADDTGAALAINAYDAWGVPNASNQGRFGYTGQTWLAELGMWYYKARIYSPTLGRFLQTDPVGYKGGIDLYEYVTNDPVNRSDSLGTNPGDPYGSARDASVDWENAYNQTSIAKNREFVGATYFYRGRYFSTPGVMRTEKGGKATVLIPHGAKVVEDVHRHADYSREDIHQNIVRTSKAGDKFDSDRPSVPDLIVRMRRRNR